MQLFYYVFNLFFFLQLKSQHYEDVTKAHSKKLPAKAKVTKAEKRKSDEINKPHLDEVVLPVDEGLGPIYSHLKEKRTIRAKKRQVWEVPRTSLPAKQKERNRRREARMILDDIIESLILHPIIQVCQFQSSAAINFLNNTAFLYRFVIACIREIFAIT